MTTNNIVEIDFWENQKYKSLRGWNASIFGSDGIPRYSDITGKVPFNFDRINSNSVYLPTGWDWCEKEWSVDMTRNLGIVDDEGWYYGASLDSMNDETKLRLLKSDLKSVHLVRRRRWVRSRICILEDALKLHGDRMNWATDVRKRITEIQNVHGNNYKKLTEYSTNQKEAIERVVASTDNTMIEVIRDLNALCDKVLAIKGFITETGVLEAEYAKRLDTLGKKWANTCSSTDVLMRRRGSLEFLADGAAATLWHVTAATAAVGTVAAAAATTLSTAKSTGSVDLVNSNVRNNVEVETGATSSQLKEDDMINHISTVIESSNNSAIPEGDSLLSKKQGSSNPSVSAGDVAVSKFFSEVCAKQRSVAKNRLVYAQLLTVTLPEDVETILDSIREALEECKSEGKEIRTSLVSRCREAELQFESYCKCYEQSTTNLASESSLLYGAIHHSSATAEDGGGHGVAPTTSAVGLATSSAAVNAGAGSDNNNNETDYNNLSDNAAALDCASLNRCQNNNKLDLWQSIQMYFTGVDEVDSVLLLYHAFGKLQSRKIPQIEAAISKLTADMMQVFGASDKDYHYCLHANKSDMNNHLPETTISTPVVSSSTASATALITQVCNNNNKSVDILTPSSPRLLKKKVDENCAVLSYVNSCYINDEDNRSDEATIVPFASSGDPSSAVQQQNNDTVEEQLPKQLTSASQELRQQQQQTLVPHYQQIQQLSTPKRSSLLKKKPSFVSKSKFMGSGGGYYDSPNYSSSSGLDSPSSSSSSSSSSSNVVVYGRTNSSSLNSPSYSRSATTNFVPAATAASLVSTPYEESREASSTTSAVVSPSSSPNKKQQQQRMMMISRSASIATVNGRTDASMFRAQFFDRYGDQSYVAYHGRLSYCVTTRADEGHRVDLTDHSLWQEAYVILTYNRVLHIMHLPHYDERDKALIFHKEKVLHSVNVRNLQVRPLFIAKEGYRDAFEIVLINKAGTNKSRRSILNTINSMTNVSVGVNPVNPKDVITSVMFVADNSAQVRDWMRVIANPFADPSIEPPDSMLNAVGGVTAEQVEWTRNDSNNNSADIFYSSGSGDEVFSYSR